MASKNHSKSFADQIGEFAGAIVVAVIVFAIILYAIYKFITEILIPVLIGLFLIALTLVLTTLLIRVCAQLWAWLTLEKRCRRKIAALDREILDLDENIATIKERMEDWPAQQRRIAETDLRQRVETRDERHVKLHASATALADHLADRLDSVNRSRRRTAHRIEKQASEELKQKLQDKDARASVLEEELKQLRIQYRHRT